MTAPQPLTIAAAAVVGFYATAGSLAIGIVRAPLRDTCGQAH